MAYLLYKGEAGLLPNVKCEVNAMKDCKAWIVYLCVFLLSICIRKYGVAAALSETSPLFLENEYLKLRIDSPNIGGGISSIIYQPLGNELTGDGGLFRDRIPPINDLWSELTYEAEIISNEQDIVTALVKSVPSEESKGLVVKKYYSLRRGQSTIEVKWEIVNGRNEDINIMPWVWCNVIPDRPVSYYMPVESGGLHKVVGKASYQPSRNWIGAIDNERNMSISFVMDYREVNTEYAWLGKGYSTLEWYYNFTHLQPGESWETTYFANILPLNGACTLAYASPEISCGIKRWQLATPFEKNEIEMELTSNEDWGNVEVKIEIHGPDNYLHTVFKGSGINLTNDKPAKLNWNWIPPKPGTYLVKAKVFKDGKHQLLGQSLQNPSSDIEFPIVVGQIETDTVLFPAWVKNVSESDESEQKLINDTPVIQAIIDEAKSMNKSFAIIPSVNPRDGSNVWIIGESIKLPSNLTLYLDNCTLRLADNVFCNIIINETVYQNPLSKADEQKNINVIGLGDAVLDGGNHNGLTERTSEKDGYPTIRYNALLYFRNVNGFQVKNIKVVDPRWWSMNFIFCENGLIDNINFNCRNNVPNQDGIDLRIGCNNIIIRNITGSTGDDTVALTALRGPDMNYLVEGKDLDIHDVTIENVRAQCVGGYAIIRLLNHDGNKMYNITIDGVYDTSIYYGGLYRKVGVRIGEDDRYWNIRPTAPGEFYNVSIKNVTVRAMTGIVINSAAITMNDWSYSNVVNFGGGEIIGGYNTTR